MDRNKVCFLFCFALLLSISLAAAENMTIEEKSRICLEDSGKIFAELSENNFSVQRVNDSLTSAKDIYDAQVILKEKKKKSDFSSIVDYCDEIKNIKENAYKARDEFKALKKFYENSFESDDINTSSVDKLLLEIENEIRNERYEKVMPLIEKSYEEISNVKASNTAMKLFYKTTTRTIKDFFKENWKMIVFGFVLFVVLFVLFYNTFRRYFIKRKISFLELRKKTIKELIKKTQKAYFEGGNISEGNYNVKMKRFGEMLRDINRQLPLLKEEMVKIRRKK